MEGKLISPELSWFLPKIYAFLQPLIGRGVSVFDDLTDAQAEGDK